jgi:hypothetical protein
VSCVAGPITSDPQFLVSVCRAAFACARRQEGGTCIGIDVVVWWCSSAEGNNNRKERAPLLCVCVGSDVNHHHP